MRTTRSTVLTACLAACLATSHLAAADTLSRDQVNQAVRKAADWQLKHPNRTRVGDWVQGPFLNGLFAISKIPGNEKYLDALIKIGEREKWGVIATRHAANDHCTPQTWLDIYAIKKDPRMLGPTRKALDAYIQVAKTRDDNMNYVHRGSKKWTWCDALYMSPPAFARMYVVTGDQKYLDYLHKWWWKASDYYYDVDEHLYYRDQTFFKKRERNGKKVFWSRGNGWVVGGLVRVLQVLDKDDPMRPGYVTQFREMCKRLAEIQCKEGLWRAGLLDPVAHTQAETSGSAFFVYAMAYGINEGILDRDRFLPVTEEAWAGLSRHLKADGRFTGTQPIGDSPKRYDPNCTMPYGVGAFLLAGSEVYKLAGKNSPCFARLVPERKDDFAWENDRIAFRMYGPGLWQNPKDRCSSGVDVWVKKVRHPIINLFKVENTFKIEGGDAATVAVGVALRGDKGHLQHGENWLSYTEPPTKRDGTTFCAVVLPRKAEFKRADNHGLLLVSVKNGETLTYYAGAGWSKGLDFKTGADWLKYVKAMASTRRPTQK